MKYTVKHIAEILYNAYYIGRPTSEDRLSLEDFEQWVKLANSSIRRRLLFALKNEEDLYNYINNNIEVKEYTEIKDDKKGSYVEVDTIDNLPKNAGLYDVRVYYLDVVNGCERPVKLNSGGSSLFCGCDYDGITFVEKKGNKVYIINPQGKISSVEIDGIFTDSSIEIDEEISWDVIKECLDIAYKGLQIPIDRVMEMNPNLLAQTKGKIDV